MLLLSHFVSDRFATPWTVARRPHSTGFPMSEYWSWLPFPAPWYLPDRGIELTSPALQADYLPLSHQGSPNRLSKWPPKVTNSKSLKSANVSLYGKREFTYKIESMILRWKIIVYYLIESGCKHTCHY